MARPRMYFARKGVIGPALCQAMTQRVVTYSLRVAASFNQIAGANAGFRLRLWLSRRPLVRAAVWRPRYTAWPIPMRSSPHAHAPPQRRSGCLRLRRLSRVHSFNWSRGDSRPSLAGQARLRSWRKESYFRRAPKEQFKKTVYRPTSSSLPKPTMLTQAKFMAQPRVQRRTRARIAPCAPLPKESSLSASRNERILTTKAAEKAACSLN